MNIAETIRKQTNKIIRQTQQGPQAGGGILIEDSAGAASTSNPSTDLTALKARLTAETNGASGADYIGATPITETGAADTVQEILEALAALIVTAGKIYEPVTFGGEIVFSNGDIVMTEVTYG